MKGGSGKYFKPPPLPVLDHRWCTRGVQGLADSSRGCHWICDRFLSAACGLQTGPGLCGGQDPQLFNRCHLRLDHAGAGSFSVLFCLGAWPGGGRASGVVSISRAIAFNLLAVLMLNNKGYPKMCDGSKTLNLSIYRHVLHGTSPFLFKGLMVKTINNSPGFEIPH